MGLYLPGNGFLHRLHPLTKMALGLAAVLLAFANLVPWRGVPLFPLMGAALLTGMVAADGVPTLVTFLKRFVLILLPLVISLILVQGFFFPGAQDVLFRIGPFALKSEGLYFGATIVSRLTLVLSAMLLLVITTHPADLTHALTGIGVPREVSYVILAALHLLPRMQARAESITGAQRARGLRTEGSLFVRARALLPLVGPLITGALHETEERALALEARAFRTPGPKSTWRLLHDSLTQRVARWALLLGSVALFIWGRFG